MKTAADRMKTIIEATRDNMQKREPEHFIPCLSGTFEGMLQGMAQIGVERFLEMKEKEFNIVCD